MNARRSPRPAAASTFENPATTLPALPAMASASRAARSIMSSACAGRSEATRTSRLNPRANTLRLTASSSATRVAVIQMPRPGNLHLTSGTTSPFGPTTKRIISAAGLTSRVRAHVRSVRAAAPAAPRSSSLSCATASIVSTIPLSPRLRGFFRCRLGGRRRRKLRLCHPARFQPSLHDYGLSVLARKIEVLEEARLMLGLAVLALRPADKIVGGAAGQILHGFHAVLAERNHHFDGDAGYVLQRVLDAQPLALGVELCLLRREVFPRTLLELACGFFIEAFDGSELFLIDHRQFVDRAKAFRSKELPDHFVEVERLDENLGAIFELGLAPLGLFLLGQNIDVPAGKLRSQSYVLTASADCKRKLLVRHHDFDALLVFVKHDLGHLGGRQCVDDESGNVGRPRNDVDLLALQFIDHCLDTRTPHADAGTDRINRRIA